MIKAFCGRDWATNPNDQWFTSGATIFLGHTLVTWWSSSATTELL